MAESDDIRRVPMCRADDSSREVLYDANGRPCEIRLPGDRVITRDILRRHARPLAAELRRYSKEDLICMLIDRTLLSEGALSIVDFELGMEDEAERLLLSLERHGGA